MLTMFTTLLAQRNLGGTFEPIGGYEVNTGSDAGDAPQVLSNFTSNMFGLLTTLAGLMFLLWFILGAIQWIIAGGDAGKIDKAKAVMTNAAIGLIIISATYSIAFIIGTVLGIQILSPVNVLESIGPN